MTRALHLDPVVTASTDPALARRATVCQKSHSTSLVRRVWRAKRDVEQHALHHCSVFVPAPPTTKPRPAAAPAAPSVCLKAKPIQITAHSCQRRPWKPPTPISSPRAQTACRNVPCTMYYVAYLMVNQVILAETYNAKKSSWIVSNKPPCFHHSPCLACAVRDEVKRHGPPPSSSSSLFLAFPPCQPHLTPHAPRCTNHPVARTRQSSHPPPVRLTSFFNPGLRSTATHFLRCLFAFVLFYPPLPPKTSSHLFPPTRPQATTTTTRRECILLISISRPRLAFAILHLQACIHLDSIFFFFFRACLAVLLQRASTPSHSPRFGPQERAE